MYTLEEWQAWLAAEAEFFAAQTPSDVDETAGVPDESGIEQPDGVAAELAGEPVSEVVDTGEMFRTFTDQPIFVLGEETTDNRILAEDGEFTFRACPMPLQWCEKNEGGHMNSVTVGVIEKMRLDGKQGLGSGYLLNIEHSEKAAQLLAHGVASPSADMGKAEWHYTDENGKKLDSNEAIMEHLEKGGSLRRKITQGHVVGATLVPFPAIGSAKLALNSEREPRDVGLVAAATADFKPRVHPHGHLEDPKLTGPTPLQMDENGRIYGHLAVFGECHRSVQSQCVMVPRSPSGYANFHTSPPIRLDNGKRIAVGRLTVGTGHADPRLRPVPAAAHYDNTGACFALVRAGEDEFGVWVSGVAAPWATTEQIEEGLASPLSGDWRNFGQGLDLIAALAVNTPGFAVQGADDDEGFPSTLVASVAPVKSHKAVPFTIADIRAAIREELATALRGQEALAGEQDPPAVEEEASTESGPDTPGESAGDSSVGAKQEAASAATQADLDAGKSPNEQAAEILEKAGV